MEAMAAEVAEAEVASEAARSFTVVEAVAAVEVASRSRKVDGIHRSLLRQRLPFACSATLI